MGQGGAGTSLDCKFRMRDSLDWIRSTCSTCSAIGLADARGGALLRHIADAPADAMILDRAAAILPELFAWLEALETPDDGVPHKLPAVTRMVMSLGPRQLVVLVGPDACIMAICTSRDAPALIRVCQSVLVGRAIAA